MVSGATVSTVQVKLAGVGSVFRGVRGSDLEGVIATGQRAVGLWTRTRREHTAVERALEGTARLGGGEGEAGAGAVGQGRGRGRNNGIGRYSVDGPGEAGGGRVGIPRGVRGSDLEGVIATGQRAVGLWTRTRREHTAVERALEGTARLGGGEGEAGAEAVGQGRWRRRNNGIGRYSVDGPGEARGGRVGIPRGVRGSDLEGVIATGQRAVGLWTRTRREAAAVERALEGTARLGGGEGEAGARAVGQGRWRRRNNGIGRYSVDGPGEARGGRVGIPRGVRGSDLEGVIATGQRAVGLWTRTRREAAAVERALEGTARLGGGESEARSEERREG